MSYPNSPFLLKGALIYFGAPMLIPIPNIIVFQYNPETMTRTLTPWQPPAKVVREEKKDGVVTNEAEVKAYQDSLASLAQPYDPAESFSLILEMDATDALEKPESHPVAVVSGIADRLAAIEMLMYPPGDSLLGGLLGSISGSVSVSAGGVSLGGSAGASLEADLERRDAPIVLFFWGPGRIVPVRITALTIEEQQYSALLYPHRAKATIALRVLTLDDLVTVTGDKATGAAAEIATFCYKFTRGQKEALALANLANSVESILGMLPV